MGSIKDWAELLHSAENEIERLQDKCESAYTQGYKDGVEDALEGTHHPDSMNEGFRNWLSGIQESS